MWRQNIVFVLLGFVLSFACSASEVKHRFEIPGQMIVSSIDACQSIENRLDEDANHLSNNSGLGVLYWAALKQDHETVLMTLDFFDSASIWYLDVGGQKIVSESSRQIVKAYELALANLERISNGGHTDKDFRVLRQNFQLSLAKLVSVITENYDIINAEFMKMPTLASDPSREIIIANTYISRLSSDYAVYGSRIVTGGENGKWVDLDGTASAAHLYGSCYFFSRQLDVLVEILSNMSAELPEKKRVEVARRIDELRSYVQKISKLLRKLTYSTYEDDENAYSITSQLLDELSNSHDILRGKFETAVIILGYEDLAGKEFNL